MLKVESGKWKVERLRVIERVEILGHDEAAVLRRLSGARRIAMLDELVEFGRGLMLARLRETHPDWTDDERRAELARRIARATE